MIIMPSPTRNWFATLLALAITVGVASPATGEDATGVVFHDENTNGRYDKGEPLLEGVRVSNGREIVKTNAEGRYTLPVDEDTIVFVIKPSGWMTPLSDDQLPQFYYIHKPAGSPESKFPGVAPTGPLPESIDFPLYKQEEPRQFQAIIFGDTQPRDQKEIDYIAHDVIEELIGTTDAKLGITLGDIMYDDLSLFGSLNRTIALVGIPWYYVIGNHDLNMDSPDDEHSDETFESVYGPAYYSFDWGPVHFLALDDVRWFNDGNDRGYTGGLGEEQMEFIRNDLALIPEDQLVVLCMHIPLVDVEDRHDLYRLIEKRPFCLSLSAHRHFHEHRLITSEDGWRGAEPHHHVITVTVCGSWFRGRRDENGIPHATMSDGAPNGYAILSFDGQHYDLQFKAARRPASYQMNIVAPEELAADQTGGTFIYANVFNATPTARVELRVGDEGPWIEMEHHVDADPAFVALIAEEASRPKRDWHPLPSPHKTLHLWRGNLPDDLASGLHLIHVRATDTHAHHAAGGDNADHDHRHVYRGKRVIRIVPSG